MDRGAWRATAHRVLKSWTRLKQLSMRAQASSKSPVQSFYLGNSVFCLQCYPFVVPGETYWFSLMFAPSGPLMCSSVLIHQFPARVPFQSAFSAA